MDLVQNTRSDTNIEETRKKGSINVKKGSINIIDPTVPLNRGQILRSCKKCNPRPVP